MIIAGNFSRVGKKTAATNDGIRLQLGRDVDPSFDFDKVAKSAIWRKHVEIDLPKKPAPPAPGTSSFKAQPRIQKKIDTLTADLSYRVRQSVTHPRSHSAQILRHDARAESVRHKLLDISHEVPDEHKVNVPLFGQYLPRPALIDLRSSSGELGEPLASSLSKRGSPDFSKLLKRKKIELDMYFEPGKYNVDGVASQRGLPPWTVQPKQKELRKAPVLSQVSPPPNF